MNTYVYPQEMKTPKLTKSTWFISGETEIRMGKTPLTTAAVTSTNSNANTPMKSQAMPTPAAATDTVILLGLVDGKELINLKKPIFPNQS